MDALTSYERCGRRKMGRLNREGGEQGQGDIDRSDTWSQLWPDESGGQRLLSLLHTATADGRKAIVFVHHRHLREQLAAGIGRWLAVTHGGGSEGGAQAARRLLDIGGETPEEDRARMVRLFTTDPCAQVLLLSMNCGSTGLNLQAAKTVIFAELPNTAGQ